MNENWIPTQSDGNCIIQFPTLSLHPSLSSGVLSFRSSDVASSDHLSHHNWNSKLSFCFRCHVIDQSTPPRQGRQCWFSLNCSPACWRMFCSGSVVACYLHGTNTHPTVVNCDYTQPPSIQWHSPAHVCKNYLSLRRRRRFFFFLAQHTNPVKHGIQDKFANMEHEQWLAKHVDSKNTASQINDRHHLL